jgi:hypothetical protein
MSTVLLLNSCSEEIHLETGPFVVGFESLSKNILALENQDAIDLIYSEPATKNGAVLIVIKAENAIYGVDFSTIPEAIDNTIKLYITAGDINNSIVFNKLSTTLDETSEINFTITAINYDNSNIQGYTSFAINTSSLGGSVTPEVGGPNEVNQVFVDLSSDENNSFTQRDSWDLGFYNGDEFRVTINGSIYMATKALEETNIDLVTEASVSSLQAQVAVGTFNPDNAAYVDTPNGNILETAIDEISENDSENPVYLLNLGYEIGTDTPTVGSAAIAGNDRGWKKIRIVRTAENYILQYANLNDTSHKEIIISKDVAYNFKHFSFNTDTFVHVEPEKEKWDICFTVFTNLITNSGSYGFSDFVIHNRKANVLSYQVDTQDFNYNDFSLANVNTSNFLKDQTTIGSNWRDVFNRTTYSNLFYIIKDSDENIYKLKFLSLTNNKGERGYPEFEYKLLQ